jgi:carnitine O-palmitoyltransferase 1
MFYDLFFSPVHAPVLPSPPLPLVLGRWLYERRPSLLTKIWGVFLKSLFFAGRRPLLYAFQGALPRQPVPNVRSTLTKFLDTVRPMLEEPK